MNYNDLKDRYEAAPLPFSHCHTDLLHYAHIHHTLRDLNILAMECWAHDFTGEIRHYLDELVQYDEKTGMIAQSLIRHLTIQDPYQRREEVLKCVRKIFRQFGFEDKFIE